MPYTTMWLPVFAQDRQADEGGLAEGGSLEALAFGLACGTSLLTSPLCGRLPETSLKHFAVNCR